MCHYHAFGSSAQRTDVYLIQHSARGRQTLDNGKIREYPATSIAFVGVRVTTGRAYADTLEKLTRGTINTDEYKRKMDEIEAEEALWLDQHLASLETSEVDG
jgi:hypothetical protein